MSEHYWEPHSKASTRIMESLTPSRNLIPKLVDGPDPIFESTSNKRSIRKDKVVYYYAIQKHLAETLDQQHLETPRKHISTRQCSSGHKISEN